MPQPSRMHTRPVIARATRSVSDFTSAIDAGNRPPTPPAVACAACVMMVLSLKPTPVSVTTPITRPTVAAAAPTASAYLAPVSKLSTIAAGAIRPATRRRFSTSRTSTACKPASSAQWRAVLPRGSVVRPTIAHELMPLNAARYGVRPVTRMLISSASGISVGQRSRSDCASRGISSGVRPRSPCRFASKCTCMNTPKKCMKAGTIAATMIVWYGTARNSIMRNAAAPSTGGVICPPVDDAASTAPANSRR